MKTLLKIALTMLPAVAIYAASTVSVDPVADAWPLFAILMSGFFGLMVVEL